MPKHRPKVYATLSSAPGRPLTHHQNHHRYVVPAAPRHGAYYTYGDAHYYTPPVTLVVGQKKLIQRTVTMEFGASKHVVELAERTEWQANELCLDLHNNYMHNPGFDQVYERAYQFLQDAKFIHNREHQTDRESIRRTAAKIDDLFHHLQADVIGLQRQENRRAGQLGLEARIEELQALIRHLMHDQGIEPRHDQDWQP